MNSTHVDENSLAYKFWLNIEGEGMEKDYHIITVGTSVLQNFYLNVKDYEYKPYRALLADEELLEAINRTRSSINEIVEYLLAEPKRASAELNGLLSYHENNNVGIDGVYLIGTDTTASEICVRALSAALRSGKFVENSIEVHDQKRLECYNSPTGDFVDGLRNLVGTLFNRIRSWRKKGYQVYLNATAGFKPEAALMVTIGSILGIPVYYIHHLYRRVVEIPPFATALQPELFSLLASFEKQDGRRFKFDTEERSSLQTLSNLRLIQPIRDEDWSVRGYKRTDTGDFVYWFNRELKKTVG